MLSRSCLRLLQPTTTTTTRQSSIAIVSTAHNRHHQSSSGSSSDAPIARNYNKILFYNSRNYDINSNTSSGDNAPSYGGTIHNSQMRFYAQKKTKKSFKRQQAEERERTRKNKRDAELRKQMQMLERMKRQQQKRQQKAEMAEGVKKMKPRVPKPPKKPVLKIPVGESNASHLTTLDPFEDFVYTRQNIDFDNVPERDGFAGLEYLSSPDLIDQHLQQIRSDVDQALAQLEEKAQQKSFQRSEVPEMMIWFDRIEAPRREFGRVRAAVEALHPDREFVNQVVSAERSLLNFFKHRVDENATLYEIVKTITDDTAVYDALSAVDKIFLRRLKAQFELSGLHVENKAEFDSLMALYKTNLAEYMNAIDSSSSITIERPSRLFQMPREDYNDISKMRTRKKRMAVINMRDHLLPVLKFVGNERVRRPVFTAAHTNITSKDSAINTHLDKLGSTADQLAKLIGYDGVGLASLQVMGVDSKAHLDDVAAMFSQLISGLNVQNEIEVLTNTKKNLQEITKTKDEVEPCDTQLLWEQHRNNVRQYDEDAVREYFPLSRCLEGVTTLFRDLFNIEVKQAKLSPGETWGPKTVKKLELFDATEGERVGIVYLDLFSREGDQKKPAATTSFVVPKLQGTMNIPVVIVSMQLGDNVLSMQPQLSHDQLRELLREFGHVAGNVLIGKQRSHNAVKDAYNPILAKTIGYVMERFAYSNIYLKTFAKHDGANSPIFDEYVIDLTAVPSYSRLSIVDQIIYSLYDTELFNKPGSKKPSNILSTLENSFAPLQVTPALSKWKEFNGTLYLDLFANILSSHVWHTIFQRGDPRVRTNAGAKLQEVFADGNLDTESGIESLIGQRLPDVKFFLKDLENPQSM